MKNRKGHSVGGKGEGLYLSTSLHSSLPSTHFTFAAFYAIDGKLSEHACLQALLNACRISRPTVLRRDTAPHWRAACN